MEREERERIKRGERGEREGEERKGVDKNGNNFRLTDAGSRAAMVNRCFFIFSARSMKIYGVSSVRATHFFFYVIKITPFLSPYLS